MGIYSAARHHEVVRPPSAPPLQAKRPRLHAFETSLLRSGLVTSDAFLSVLAGRTRQKDELSGLLTARGVVAAQEMTHAMADHWKTSVIDPASLRQDPRLIDQFGPEQCLRLGLLPVQRLGGATLVVTAHPERFALHRPALEDCFGPIAMAIGTGSAIEKAVMKLRGAVMAQRAEERVPDAESCRRMAGHRLVIPAILGVALLALIMVFAPNLLAWSVVIWSTLTLLMCSALKLAAGLAAGLRQPERPVMPPRTGLPTVSIIVALYREADVANRLVRRLDRLDYPRDLLDVVLAVEDDDAQTQAALATAHLPSWMRIIRVPPGKVRTKPRALNFALDHCRGEVVGVYDAEDAPAHDQLRRVVERFAQEGEDLACIQGVLDFYNPTTNWLARCFTIEYATWFRLILPGLLRLGLPIPLGGTTLFFRREAIEKIGGWDAHNVTEDADLGIRLYRHGYRTEWIDSVTLEEANCRTLPWIKQRSRWLKGYMMTWATHMRSPRLLLKQLGLWRFFGFQILFLGTISQYLLAPVLWSFWLAFLGFAHPIGNAMPSQAGLMLMALFLATEIINFSMGVAALRRSGHKINPLWVASLHLYFPLGALASYKAAWEVVRKPFYWDKTAHGYFDMAAELPTPQPPPPTAAQPFRRNSPASTRKRVSKARLICVFKA